MDWNKFYLSRKDLFRDAKDLFQAGTSLFCDGFPSKRGVIRLFARVTRRGADENKWLHPGQSIQREVPLEWADGDTADKTFGGNGKFMIQRTGDLSSALTVNDRTKGPAKAGVDNKTLSGTVTIPTGASKVKIKPIVGSPAHGSLRSYGGAPPRLNPEQTQRRRAVAKTTRGEIRMGAAPGKTGVDSTL